METLNLREMGNNLRALGAEADASEWGDSGGDTQADAGRPGPEARTEGVGTPQARGAGALGDATRQGTEAREEEAEGPARAALGKDGGAEPGVPARSDTGDDSGPAAADYEALAKHLEGKGEAELAKQARQQAAVLQALEEQAEAQSFQRRWWEQVNRTVEGHPELRDPQSALANAVRGVLQETRLYALSPDGFAQATALAKARVEAAAAPSLRSRVEELTRENERLVKLTSVLGSGPTASGEEPGLEGMSLRDGERHLRRLAAEADRGE